MTPPAISTHVALAVHRERIAQDERFGPARERRLAAGTWLAVLMEEVGEAANAMLEKHGAGAGEVCMASALHYELEAELVQVAAVALAWLEAIDGMRAELEERAA